jgi:cytidine deaminase
MSELSAEDAKLVTLARAARTRAYVPYTGAAEGAAVRDTDGRAYAAATVENVDPDWTTTALRGAIAAAASSGSRRFEAAAVVTERDGEFTGEPMLGEFGVPLVLVAGPDGVVRRTWSP